MGCIFKSIIQLLLMSEAAQQEQKLKTFTLSSLFTGSNKVYPNQQTISTQKKSKLFCFF